MFLRDWIGALRLKTILLSLAGILLAALLVWSQQQVDNLLVLLSLLSVIFLQILSNLANDYGDAIKGTDKHRLIQDRKVSSGKISPQKMRWAIYITAVAALIFCALSTLRAFGQQWLSLLYGGLVLSALWAAIAYTIGRKPYGYRAMGDVFVFVFFGLMSVCGGYYLFAHRWDIWVILPASSIGLLSASVLNINNMRDLEQDRKSNKRTIPGMVGLKRAKQYQTLLVILPFLFALGYKIYYFKGVGQFIFLLLFIPFMKHLLRLYRSDEPMKIHHELPKVAAATLHFSILFGLGEQELIAYYI